jgi:purine-binding chemotaxis protein CheW
MPELAAAAGRRYIVFRLGTVEYAVDAEQVRRSMPAPPVLRADIGYLGQMYPVLDLRALFGQVPAGGAVRLVLLAETPAGRAALAVDALIDLRSIAEAAIAPLPELFQGAERRWLAGLARLDGRVVAVLRLEAILAAHPVLPPDARPRPATAM